MKSTENQERVYNILVYGFEQKGLPVPAEPLRMKNYSVFFERYGTARRFQEYDGVVLFQGLFETFERRGNYGRSYLLHKYDPDELDKRKKETTLLLEKEGFLCYLLTELFVDHADGRDYSRTDLVKYQLSHSQFYRENFASRHAHLAPVLSEFKRFLDMFGAANSYFTSYNDSLDFCPLATSSGKTVGFVLNRGEYVVPSLVPDSREDIIKEYLELLIDAVTAVQNKMHQTLPEWIVSYKFEEEDSLSEKRDDLRSAIAEVDDRFQKLAMFKAALFHSGPDLVADVGAILHAALGTPIDAIDDLREDIKLLDDDGKVIAICEVKGINRGVGRENINQTDSHRARSGFDDQFPALLIANTNIKNARSIAEKDQEIDGQQIRHAVNMRILVMRTIDLLGVLRLVLAGKVAQEDARALILGNVGWLRVEGDRINVLNGQ
ncbi:hypothetical protein [Paraburkholderia sp. BCC1885]|uniref:hypothetical protein n=1 Tax=Paraburkholderia sp. BCC1885 TaxID=2562669 RepID=UPI00118275AA|nr:hypothetical protein [Paraburkholderia sp. BCC1885]